MDRQFTYVLLLVLTSLIACQQAYKPDRPKTIRQPGSKLSIRKAKSIEQIEGRVQADRFGIALRQLQLTAAERLADESDERSLVQLFELLKNGKYTALIEGLADLKNQSDDANVQQLTMMMKAKLHYMREEWAEINVISPDNPVVVPYLEKPPMEVTIEPVYAKLEMQIGPTGSPLVPVMINGQKRWFWFDTGAALSVISAQLADSLGVESLGGAADLATSNKNMVSSSFGYVQDFEVGSLKLKNHAVFLIDEQQLQFTLNDESTMRIEGILGWNAIRLLRWELDYQHGVCQNGPSVPSRASEYNFYWMGYPLVRLWHPSGTPLLFGLDTGSNNTSVQEPYFEKVDPGPYKMEEVTIGGAGGKETFETKVVKRLNLRLRDYIFQLKDSQMEKEEHAFFVQTDGTIGSDMMLGSNIIIDFPASFFNIKPFKE